MTVIAAVPVAPPDVAVTVVAPGAMVATRPVADTVAMPESDEDHATGRPTHRRPVLIEHNRRQLLCAAGSRQGHRVRRDSDGRCDRCGRIGIGRRIGRLAAWLGDQRPSRRCAGDQGAIRERRARLERVYSWRLWSDFGPLDVSACHVGRGLSPRGRGSE